MRSKDTITDKMVKAAHRAFHIEWWQLPPGKVCTETCGASLDKAIWLALEAAIRAERRAGRSKK